MIDVPVLTDKQQKKVIEREEECEREEIFSDQIAMKLARGLAKDEWVKLAYALGFLPQVRFSVIDYYFCLARLIYK